MYNHTKEGVGQEPRVNECYRFSTCHGIGQPTGPRAVRSAFSQEVWGVEPSLGSPGRRKRISLLQAVAQWLEAGQPFPWESCRSDCWEGLRQVICLAVKIQVLR